MWGKIDMTNSFFQTIVHSNHVKYMATLTLFGLWEWVVMPMGLCNSPATHQHHVTMALKDLIRCICHVYLDDIIIWSQTLAEHEHMVLKALWTVHLYCSLKKSLSFNTELNFLGHTISQCRIEADGSKIECILNWPMPTNTKEVWQFLGLVWYISAFLPVLVEHTLVLTPLMHKECNAVFPTWTTEHHNAFQAIKALVILHNCLTMIDHQNSADNKIYVTCDASQRCNGTVLSFGTTWETAQLVAFKSWQLCSMELHYPVYKQEMLAIIHALKKWRSDLLGSHITIYTDHQCLLRQKRWPDWGLNPGPPGHIPVALTNWAIRSYWVQVGRSDMLYCRLQVLIATASRHHIWLLCPSWTTI